MSKTPLWLLQQARMVQFYPPEWDRPIGFRFGPLEVKVFTAVVRPWFCRRSWVPNWGQYVSGFGHLVTIFAPGPLVITWLGPKLRGKTHAH